MYNGKMSDAENHIKPAEPPIFVSEDWQTERPQKQEENKIYRKML
jgi:hypothetical protein